MPGPRFSTYLRDRRIRCRRLEQLERWTRQPEEMRADTLRRHLLGRFDLQPERVAIERERRRQIRHRDADVIEDGFHLQTWPSTPSHGTRTSR